MMYPEKNTSNSTEEASKVEATRCANTTEEIKKKNSNPVQGGDVNKEDTAVPFDDVLGTRVVLTDEGSIKTTNDEAQKKHN